MVPPMINRVRGKTLEQRRRQRAREKKANRKESGKKTKHGLGEDSTRRKGAVKEGAPTKKGVRPRRPASLLTHTRRRSPRPATDAFLHHHATCSQIKKRAQRAKLQARAKAEDAAQMDI